MEPAEQISILPRTLMPSIPPHTLYRNRSTDETELPWVRPADLAKLDLPRPVVLVNGVFDLLHSGHLKLLFAARSKAATVVCGLESDNRARKAKGEGRPILNWIERATALAYTPIDYLVEIDNEGDMKRLVAAISPDLRVQSEEYKGKPSRFPTIPKLLVRLGKGMSTTEIIRRINDTSRTSKQIRQNGSASSGESLSIRI